MNRLELTIASVTYKGTNANSAIDRRPDIEVESAKSAPISITARRHQVTCIHKAESR